MKEKDIREDFGDAAQAKEIVAACLKKQLLQSRKQRKVTHIASL